MFPGNRLFLLFVVVFLPGITLVGSDSAYLPMGLLFILVGALILCSDILFSFRLTSKVKLVFEPLYRLTCNVEDQIIITIDNPERKRLMLRIGISFPDSITCENRVRDLTLTKDLAIQLEWPCKPMTRGLFHIDQCCFEVRSMFGFFYFRKEVKNLFEIKVYPNLNKEYRKLASMFLNRNPEGAHTWKMLGKGREFEKLREYIPGDSFNDIHWKTSAKRGKPVTKVYQIEKTQHVYVVIDNSMQSGKMLQLAKNDSGSGQLRSCLEQYISSSLIMASAAQRHGDCFGLLTFSNRAETFIKAGRGPRHYNLFRDALYNLQVQDVNQDFHDVISTIRLKIPRRSMILFLTHLDDSVLAEEFLHSVSLISQKHLVVVGVMQDRNVHALFKEPVVQEYQLIEQLENHFTWQNLANLERQLRSCNVQLFKFQPEKISAQLINAYITIKQKQLI
ncbi:MAG: DUF58 domain-containing protein [Fibrobacteria bacterium]|nr:DUF58 domain-containing protein [Fibrobacteria bacterium]